VSSVAKSPLISDTIGKRNQPDFFLPKIKLHHFSFSLGHRLDCASDVFGNKEAFIFSQSGQRLTFKSLKAKVSLFYQLQSVIKN
jgi:hypothetical protein